MIFFQCEHDKDKEYTDQESTDLKSKRQYLADVDVNIQKDHANNKKLHIVLNIPSPYYTHSIFEVPDK